MPDSCCPGLEELCLRGDRAGNVLLPRCCCAGVSAAVLTRKEKCPSAKSSCMLFPASWLLFSPCRLWATALPLNSIPRPNFSLRVVFTLVTYLCFFVLSLSFKFYSTYSVISHACEHGTCTSCERGGQPTTRRCQFSLSNMWVLGIKFRLLDLTTSVFTYWVILSAPFFLYYFKEGTHQAAWVTVNVD